ncbi:MAG TPA: hypothetical protein PKH89_08800 [Anaerolineae bacterium]|nr:hypothetical protein [Anaerolineae bacterium]
MRIRVNTEQLKSVARLCGQTGSELDRVKASSLRAWYGLGGIEFRQRGDLENCVQQSQRLGGKAVQSCRDAERRLTRFAESMEAVDREMAALCDAVNAPLTSQLAIGLVVGKDRVGGEVSAMLSDAGTLVAGAVAAVRTLTDVAFISSDSGVGRLVDTFLPLPGEGGSESASITATAGATLEGFYVEPGSTIELTRNEDGTMSVAITGSAEAGLKAETGAKGKIKFMDKKYGADLSAEQHVGIKTEQTMTYQYDPTVPGDLTKMGFLLGSLGVAVAVPAALVTWVGAAPSADHLQSVSMSGGVSTGGSASASLGFPVASIGYSGDATMSIEYRRNELGQREEVFTHSTALEEEGTVVLFEDKTSVETSYARIHNLDTDTWSTEITNKVQAAIGDTVDIEGVKKKGLIPKDITISGGIERYEAIEVIYRTGDHPDQVMRQLNPDGRGIRVQNIPEGTEVEVTATRGRTFDAGFELGAAAGHSAAVEAGLELNRESTVRLYPPADVRPPRAPDSAARTPAESPGGSGRNSARGADVPYPPPGYKA